MSRTEVNFYALYGRQKLLELFQKISPPILIVSVAALTITSRYPWITFPAFFMMPILGIGFLKLSAKKNKTLHLWSGITIMPLIFIVCFCGGPHSPTFIVGFTNLLFISINFTRKIEKALMTLLSLGTILTGSLLSDITVDLVLEGMLCLLIYFYIINQLLNFSLTQANQIAEAKHEIQEKHREITDSINYAERIQRSFLATQELLDLRLKNYFVLFKPKDVVSGDFYWAADLENGAFAFATADSTGHGVPGAIMSILNISSLEHAVENGARSPSEILNQARHAIIERLKKDGSANGGSDGMDASLICLDPLRKKIKYSCANNLILIVRDGQVLELERDKMPVGRHEKDKELFTEHEFELEPNDMIYTLTDGFADQFGGDHGKKFMYKKLKGLLLSIAGEKPDIQKNMLDAAFDSWKGKLEQVDDVCVVGIRI